MTDQPREDRPTAFKQLNWEQYAHGELEELAFFCWRMGMAYGRKQMKEEALNEISDARVEGCNDLRELAQVIRSLED